MKEYKYSFRVSEEHWEYVSKMCESTGITPSAYFRKLIESQMLNENALHLTSKEERECKRRLVNEINKIGVNVNQIVRNVNSNFYSRNEKAQLFELLNKIYGLLE